ncbi:tetratricopeptide repeat protein [Candidatus Fermentibacteria bacterium]|nr:tetratricopeptide repeat protein [Candidatus Fermentibacteria bacterium]
MATSGQGGQASTEKRVGRSVTPHPAFMTLAIVIVLLGASAASLALRPMLNYDIWRNLTVGQWIVENGRVPHEEVFTFTERGRPWIDYEWLSELVFYGVHQIGGYAGLVAYEAVLVWVTGAGLLLLFLARSHGSPWVLVLAAVPAFVLSEFHILVRPHLHSMALAPLFLWWVWRPRQWRAVGVAVLFCLWANLHSGTLGVLLLVLSLLGGIPRTGRVRTVVAAGVGLLVNPYSWRIVLPLVRVLSAQAPGGVQVTEWMPLPFDEMRGFWAYLVFSLLLLCVPGRSHRRWDTVMLVTFGALSMKAVRMVPFLALMAVPGNAEALGCLAGHRWTRYSRWIGAVAAVAATTVLVARHMPLSLHPDPRACPEAAASYLLDRNLDIRCYNDIHQGAYLMWRWFPRLVYSDNRTELFGDVASAERAACGDVLSFKVFLESYGIRGAVLDYPWKMDDTETATFYPLFRFLGWHTVAWDDGGALLLAPGTDNDSIIAADAFHVLDPFVVDPPFNGLSSQERELLLAEARRARRSTSRSSRAWEIWGNIASSANRPATALAAFDTVAALNRRDVNVHARRALALEKLGKHDAAAREWKRQASRKLDLPLVWFNLGRLALVNAQPKQAESWLRKAVRAKADERSWRDLLAFARSATAAQLSQQQAGLRSSAASREREAMRSMGRGEWELAERTLREAISLVPSVPTFHQNLGASLASQELWEEAEAELREALLLDSNLGWARYNLAGLLATARGDTVGAVRELQALAASGPDSALSDLAQAYLREIGGP